MKNLSGWSLLWITLSVLAVIGTIFQVIQYNKRKKEDTKKADVAETFTHSAPIMTQIETTW